jgi:hypothetical protein
MEEIKYKISKILESDDGKIAILDAQMEYNNIMCNAIRDHGMTNRINVCMDFAKHFTNLPKFDIDETITVNGCRFNIIISTPYGEDTPNLYVWYYATLNFDN